MLTRLLTGLLMQGVAGTFFAFSLANLESFGQARLAPWLRLPPDFLSLGQPGQSRGLWPRIPWLSGQALTPVFPGLAGLLMQGYTVHVHVNQPYECYNVYAYKKAHMGFGHPCQRSYATVCAMSHK